MITLFQKSSPLDRKITELSQEARRLAAEMNAISPVNQFAAYFKKQRAYNKINDELKTLSWFSFIISP